MILVLSSCTPNLVCPDFSGDPLSNFVCNDSTVVYYVEFSSALFFRAFPKSNFVSQYFSGGS